MSAPDTGIVDDPALAETVRAYLPPFARHMAMDVVGSLDGMPVIAFDYGVHTMGRPGFLHGGALSGLLEIAAIAALRTRLAGHYPGLTLKPVNITVDFMRGGREHRTFALGHVTRLGRRIANVEAHAWQSDPGKRIASARMNLLLAGPG